MMDGDQKELFIRPPVHLVLAAVTIGGIFYLLGQYVASQPQRAEKELEAKREIVVEGRGEVQEKPDVARLTLGVSTGVQPSAKAALDILSKRFDAVVAAVKASGVKEDDVKTTNLSIHPQYDYRDGRQVLRGFEASESIAVTIRDLTKIGDVLAKATIEGVNQAGGISFEIDDPDAIQEQAEEEAIKDARENAERLAKELGVRLGRVKAFAVSSAETPPPPFFAARLEAQGLGGEGPPVPAGTEEIAVTVTITYELR